MDSNEPGAAVLALYAALIDRVKQTQPMRSDDKPLKGGRVYSMLTLGQPIDPDDYKDPWNPQGAGPATPVIPPPPANMTPAGSTPVDPNAPVADSPATLEASRALKAAFNTSQLCTKLLSVTDSQSYEEYPDGRNMQYSYPAILAGMHPVSADEPQDPAVVATVKKANAVLYLLNDDGTPSVNPTPMFQNYQNNSQAYGNAVGNYATAYGIARQNPQQMAVWPVASRPLQMAVTQARQALISQGAAQVEGALDALATVGFPYQAHLVAAAQASYDDWSVPLGGSVSALSPYCQIMPSDWASDAPGACHAWETLTVSSSDYKSLNVTSALASSQFSWFTKASNVGGGGSASYLGFIKVSGSASSSSSAQGSNNSSNQNSKSTTFQDAKGLTIKMTYALCTVQRPWFAGDIFYMQNWYMNGGAKGSISTGNIADQINLPNQLLPMVPQQMLVVRDVTISATSWGSFASELTSAFGASGQGSSTSSNAQAGSAGFSLGFISIGGSASHAATKAQGGGSSVAGSNASRQTSFNHLTSTLTIPGAQIMGWLCDITPTAPPLDDPELGKVAAATPTATSASPTTTTPLHAAIRVAG